MQLNSSVSLSCLHIQCTVYTLKYSTETCHRYMLLLQFNRNWAWCRVRWVAVRLMDLDCEELYPPHYIPLAIARIFGSLCLVLSPSPICVGNYGEKGSIEKNKLFICIDENEMWNLPRRSLSSILLLLLRFFWKFVEVVCKASPHEPEPKCVKRTFEWNVCNGITRRPLKA